MMNDELVTPNRSNALIFLFVSLSSGLIPVGACAGRWIRTGISEPAILVGEGLIEYKELFSLLPAEEGGRAEIFDVFSTTKPTTVAVAVEERSKIGEFNGIFLRIVDSQTGAVQSSQLFDTDLYCRAQAIDIDGDDVFETMCTGGGFSDVGLLDAEGNTRWSFVHDYGDEGGAAEHLSPGDIDGDGDLEFRIGFSVSLGCFDEEGKEIWRVTNLYWYDPVAVVTAGENLPLMLAVRSPNLSREDYYLEVRNGSGDLLSQRVVPDGYYFDVVQWPPDQTEPSLVTRIDSSITFRNLEGELVLEYPVPGAITDVNGYTLDYDVLQLGSQKYLLVNFAAEYVHNPGALVGGLPQAVRSALVLYDSIGEIAYFEVLDDVVTIRSHVVIPPGDKKVLMTKGSTVFELHGGPQ